MIIRTTIELSGDDSFAYTADQAAAEIIAALDGDPGKDSCYVTIQQAAIGQAGYSDPDPLNLNPA